MLVFPNKTGVSLSGDKTGLLCWIHLTDNLHYCTEASESAGSPAVLARRSTAELEFIYVRGECV